MRGNDRLTNRKADACSRILGAEEAVKDAIEICGRNAQSVREGKDAQPLHRATARCRSGHWPPDCVIDWRLLTGRLMITCRN
jgi:hypothetical protein